MKSLFAETCARIQAAYEALDHELGWRFLTSPAAMLNPSTEIALITLNPGGDRKRPDHGCESSEAGSAYLVESWKSGSPPGEAPLQVQVRRLFAMIASVRGIAATGDDLLGQSLTAQFVPFRSPSLKALRNRKASFAFARKLWVDLFEHISPCLVITIDTHTRKDIVPILVAKWGEPTSIESFPTGWGTYQAELVLWDTTVSGRALIRLPHLSTFKLFSREASTPHLERIIGAAVECCWGAR